MAIVPLQLARVSDALRLSVSSSTITRTQKSLLDVQNELATGKKLNVPSDDPAASSLVMTLRKTLEQRQAYASNLRQAGTQLGETDSTLGDVTDLLQQAVTTAQANVGSDVTADQRSAAAEIVKNIYGQLLSIANKQFQGSYLFGGTRANQPPYVQTSAGLQFVGSTAARSNQYDENTFLPFEVAAPYVFGGLAVGVAGSVALAPSLDLLTPVAQLRGGAGIDTAGLQITNGTASATISFATASTVEDVLNAINSAGVRAQINAAGTGIDILNATSGTGAGLSIAENGGTTAADLGVLTDPAAPVETPGVFTNTAKLRDALLSGDQAAITSAAAALKDDLDRVIRLRGLVGAHAAEIQDRTTRLEDQNLATKTLLSSLEDTDFTDAITRFQSLQTALQAALQSSGRILNQSLLDFLQ